ncbi:MAG: FCD domain-containing protein [Pseudomonadota bacterium]
MGEYLSTPLKTKGQTRHVFERLRADILGGKLPPGAKLNIAALAEDIQVSAGAVREALAMLEAEALVVSEPARGYRVSPVSLAELQELVQARIEIEKLCIAEAIRNGGLEWEGGIVAAYHRLSRTTERVAGEPGLLNPEWAAAHADFHRAVVIGCPNRWLLRMHETLYQQSERYRQLTAPLKGGDRDVNAEHKALLDAALNHDILQTQNLMTAHLKATARQLLESPHLAQPANQAAP